MSNCDNHWCENYSSGKTKCEGCKKHNNAKDRFDLRVIHRRKVLEQTGVLEPSQKKENGISR